MEKWMIVTLFFTAHEFGKKTISSFTLHYMFKILNVSTWLISKSIFQCAGDKTKLNNRQDKWLQMKQLKLLYCAITLPVILMHTSSGTNNYQTDHQHSFWVNFQLVKELLRMNSKTGFLQHWTPHQEQFHWWSRICVCLTLLCTTVLWSPQWMKHTQHSYKNTEICHNPLLSS